MPNWVHNKIIFSDRGREILDKCVKEIGDKYKEDIFDFNEIIPMPKELSLISGSSQNNAIAYALSKKSDEKREEIRQKLSEVRCDFYTDYLNKFERYNNREDLEELAKYFEENKKCGSFDNTDYDGLGIKTLEDLGNRYIQNVLEYGYDTWYDWSCGVWGTKWNSCNCYEIDDNKVEFDTAWSCPIGVLTELSKQYNDIEIYVEYADEDLGYNCGSFVLRNGIMDEYCEGDLEFAMEVWDYDEEYKEEIRNGDE